MNGNLDYYKVLRNKLLRNYYEDQLSMIYYIYMPYSVVFSSDTASKMDVSIHYSHTFGMNCT